MSRLLTTDNLHTLTQDLLEIKSQKDDRKIQDIYSLLCPNDREISNAKAFYKLIKLFHPDRIEFHNQNILKMSDSTASEIVYENLFQFLDKTKNISNTYSFNEEVIYGYDSSDFDDINNDDFSNNADDQYMYHESLDYDLIDAFKDVFLGNDVNIIVTPSMISMTSGYVDFSDLDINKIDGVEHFDNIERLNLNHNALDSIYGIEALYQLKELYLSDNSIDNIEDLQKLEALEILDISRNEIYDFTPLLSLCSLKFVNIKNNPPMSNKMKTVLVERGIIVID